MRCWRCLAGEILQWGLDKVRAAKRSSKSWTLEPGSQESLQEACCCDHNRALSSQYSVNSYILNLPKETYKNLFPRTVCFPQVCSFKLRLVCIFSEFWCGIGQLDRQRHLWCFLTTLWRRQIGTGAGFVAYLLCFCRAQIEGKLSFCKLNVVLLCNSSKSNENHKITALDSVHGKSAMCLFLWNTLLK